jgi:hypothetical protein
LYGDPHLVVDMFLYEIVNNIVDNFVATWDRNKQGGSSDMKTELVCARGVEFARAAFGCRLGPAALLQSFGVRLTASAAGGVAGRSRVQSRGVPLEAPA